MVAGGVGASGRMAKRTELFTEHLVGTSFGTYKQSEQKLYPLLTSVDIYFHFVRDYFLK